MKDICIKCNNKKYGIDTLNEKCSSCRHKEDMRYLAVLFVIGFIIIVGVRVIWAKFVYNDIRCVLAECRINK